MSKRPPKAKKEAPPKADLNEVLRSWATVQVNIAKLSLEELEEALRIELKGKKRPTVISRLATRCIVMSKGRHYNELITRLSA